MRFACSPHMSNRMLSEPHIYNLEKEKRDSGSVEGGTFRTYCFSTHSPSKMSSSQTNLHTICACLKPFILVFFFHTTPQVQYYLFFHIWEISFEICFYSELVQALRNSPSADIETLHKFPNLWISVITLILKMLLAEAMFCSIAATWPLEQVLHISHKCGNQNNKYTLISLKTHSELKLLSLSGDKQHSLGRAQENSCSTT